MLMVILLRPDVDCDEGNTIQLMETTVIDKDTGHVTTDF